MRWKVANIPRLHISLFIFFCTHSYIVAGQSSWHTWKHNGISMLTPQDLLCGSKMHNQDHGDDILSFKITNCAYQVDASSSQSFKLPLGTIFMVNTLEYPENFIPADSLDIIRELLLSSIPGRIRDYSATTQYTTFINYGNFQGLAYRLSYDDGKMTVKTKAFYIDRRLVTVQVYTTKANMLHDCVDRFLDSFQYIPLK